MSGGGGGGDTEYSQDPWVGQQPYLLDIWEKSKQLPRQEPYPFPGYVPWSPTTIGAMGATTERAMAGSPLLTSAQAENLKTTSGGYLDITQRPEFLQAFRTAASNIIPGIQGQAVGAGRYGGGLTQQQQIEALSNQFFNQWAPMYEAERDRMMKSTMMGPALAEADYGDIQKLYGVGQMQEQKAQQALQDAMARWQFQQQAPYQQIGAQAPIVGGTSFGQQGIMPQQGGGGGISPVSGALGGAMAGSAIMPGWGTAIGAGAGLIASML